MDFNGFVDRFGSERMLTQGILITEVLLLLYGIFLLVLPAQALRLSVAAIGVALIIAGIACGVSFVLHRQDGNFPLVALAAVGIIVGILAIVFRNALALILFPIMLGIWTLFTAVAASFSALANHRLGSGLWWIPLLAAVVALAVTILIFMNLSGTERFMARILGIYFITYNIVRLGEFGALRVAPAEASPRGRRSSSGSHRRGTGNGDPADRDYDVYDYREEERSYRRSSYDDLYDDDEDYRRYRRERGYDD